MKTINRKTLIISIIITISIALLIFIFYAFVKIFFIQPRKRFKNESFNGIIKEIKYDQKRIPTVRTWDSIYYLGIYSYGFNEIIQLNDSLVKEKGAMDYQLYRKDSNETWQLIYGEP